MEYPKILLLSHYFSLFPFHIYWQQCLSLSHPLPLFKSFYCCKIVSLSMVHVVCQQIYSKPSEFQCISLTLCVFVDFLCNFNAFVYFLCEYA